MIVIMKRSIKRLPKRTQEELAVLQELILQYLVNVRMIILYGSYARGEYVIWDETYDERGGLTYYQSDLDILVICDTGDAIKAENHANAFVVPRYDKRMEGRRHPAPPQIIVESTTTFNRAIRRKHYFFYEALRDGILLYDDGTFQIGKPEKLPYREIKQYAEEEYAGCFDMAEGLLRHGKLAQVEKEYKLGSFFYIKLANVTTRRICLSIVALALNPINWKCWARWLKAVHEVSRMYFQLILPKIEKRLINYVGRISKLGTTDYSLSVKNNTNTCWHERKHCAR